MTKRVITFLLSLTIVSVIIVFIHEKFMQSVPAGTEPIVGMEILAVVALIVAYTMGHVVAVTQKEKVEIKLGDITKILFTVFASGLIYLGLQALFKTPPK